MLYPYKYIENHPVYGLHENITYFFEQLFNLDLPNFDEKQHLKPEFLPLAKASRKRFIGNFKSIVTAYFQLSIENKKIVKQAFKTNNAIEDLCLGVNAAIKYSQLPKSIQGILKSFFIDLWESYPQNQKIETSFGTVKAHHEAFTNALHQKVLLCPFCGINPLKPSIGLYRDAYDHYIPKGMYPFNSVNFKNLVPICHECNSDEKKATDTTFKSDGSQRKIKFPYSTTQFSTVEVSIKINEEYNPIDLKTYLYSFDNWQISLTENGQSTEELETWEAVFNVSRRYKERIKQFEREWWRWMLINYKNAKVDNISFNKFKKNWFELNFYDILDRPMAIIQKSYYEFLFNIPDCELILDDSIGLV